VPIAQVSLKVDQGQSLNAGPFCWVGGGACVDFRGTSPLAIFRQRPTDSPLVQLTGSPSALGQVVFGAPIPNFPIAVSDGLIVLGALIPNFPIAASEATPSQILVTLYPVFVYLTPLGVSYLVFPYCKWSLSFAWPSGQSFQLVAGDVEVSSV
jgi:hypothetical protein